MRNFLYCALAAAAAVVLWLRAGRSITVFIDRFHTVRLQSHSPDRFRFDAGVLEAGPRRLYLESPEYTRPAQISLSPLGRAELKSGGQSFSFGPARTLPSPSGIPNFEFTPDPGDVVSLSQFRGMLAWPVFEMNVVGLGGNSTARRRSIYWRLEWSKRSGAHLEMLWRAEQNYYRAGGWNPPDMDVVAGGLTQVRITGDSSLRNAAVRYLTDVKHWKPEEYRLEFRGPAAGANEEIVMAIHRDDERHPLPGAGRSLELRVDYRSRRVIREIAGQ